MLSSVVLTGLLAAVGGILLLIGLGWSLWGRGRPFLALVFFGLAAAVAYVGSAVCGPLVFPCGISRCDLDAGIRISKKRTRILDRHGRLIGILEQGRSPWVPLTEIPDFVQALVIQREDRRFWVHHGVDFVGVIGAIRSNLGGTRRGASTIAMQAAQLTMGQFGLRVLPPDGTFRGKLAELAVGGLLLDKIGHEGVLEIYLNSVPMGPVFGFEAAAHREFARRVRDVTVAQGATLASMIKAPSRLSPCHSIENAEEERRQFLTQLANRGAALQSDAQTWADEPLIARCPPRGPKDDALRAIRDQLIEYGDTLFSGDSLRSHIDLDVQNRAWTELRGALEQVEQRSQSPQLQGIAVVVGEGGRLRAWISGHPGLRTRGYDRVRFGRIRLGSTLKPFLLASALERGLVDPEDTLGDLESALRLDLSDSWVSRIRRGVDPKMTVSQALARSENWLGVLLWNLMPEWERQRLNRAGIPLGPSKPLPSALGTGVVSPAILATAYSSLVVEGALFDPRLYGRPEAKAMEVWRGRTVGEMRDALQRVAIQGTGYRGGRIAESRKFQLALKTGTVADSRGWTQEMVIAGSRLNAGEILTGVLWVGCDHPSAIMRSGTAGEFLAAPLARVLAPR